MAAPPLVTPPLYDHRLLLQPPRVSRDPGKHRIFGARLYTHFHTSRVFILNYTINNFQKDVALEEWFAKLCPCRDSMDDDSA